MAQGTMQKVTNDSGTGYCKMPDGTLIQWVKAIIASSGDRIQFTFPIPFVSDLPAILLTPHDSGNGDVHIVVWNSSLLSAYALKRSSAAFSNNQTVWWMAIGRWK